MCCLIFHNGQPCSGPSPEITPPDNKFLTPLHFLPGVPKTSGCFCRSVFELSKTLVRWHSLRLSAGHPEEIYVNCLDEREVLSGGWSVERGAAPWPTLHSLQLHRSWQRNAFERDTSTVRTNKRTVYDYIRDSRPLGFLYPFRPGKCAPCAPPWGLVIRAVITGGYHT